MAGNFIEKADWIGQVMERSSKEDYGLTEKTLVSELGIRESELGQYVVDQLVELDRMIPAHTKELETSEQLIQRELKRRAGREAAYWKVVIDKNPLSYRTFLQWHGIMDDDFIRVAGWLEENREKAVAARQKCSIDIPDEQRVNPERVAEYHRHLSKLIEERLDILGFSQAVVVESTDLFNRFYSMQRTVTINLDVPIAYPKRREDKRKVSIDEFLYMYGHEVMGHVAHWYQTQNASIPKLMKFGTSLVTPSDESIAFFYERQLLGVLQDSPETLRALGIADFDAILERKESMQHLARYFMMVGTYAAHLVASAAEDRTIGDELVQGKIYTKLAKVTIFPEEAGFYMQKIWRFDHEGNLDSSVFGDTFYATDGVDQGLKAFATHGKTYNTHKKEIDRAILTGCWTREGFEEHMKLAARRNAKSI